MKLDILFKNIIIYSFGQFFDHHERFHHFIYIFRQMRRISDDFQSHNHCKPNCRPLFGTTLKTPRTHFSKMTQSDCAFDEYATIVVKYRMKFSTDVVGAKRYLPKHKSCVFVAFSAQLCLIDSLKLLIQYAYN